MLGLSNSGPLDDFITGLSMDPQYQSQNLVAQAKNPNKQDVTLNLVFVAKPW